MADFSINELLDHCIAEDGVDIHLVAGQPAVIRCAGRFQKYRPARLDPTDTTRLMKSITPESRQRELNERGATDFTFMFRDRIPFRVAAFRHRKIVSLVLRRVSKANDISHDQ